jgi:hypothetical protein
MGPTSHLVGPGKLILCTANLHGGNLPVLYNTTCISEPSNRDPCGDSQISCISDHSHYLNVKQSNNSVPRTTGFNHSRR